MTVTNTLIAVFCTAVIIILERAFPFILFSKRNPPKIIGFIEKYIPSMVMAVLLVYCLKDISFVKNSSIDLHGFVPYTAGVTTTIVLHLWKRNSLISIFTGTAVYMILIRVL